VDAASCPELEAQFNQHTPPFECLFAGKLKADVAGVAPYVVALQPDNAFTRWLIGEGWGCHWGIFAGAPADLKSMHRRLRQYLKVRGPDDTPLYFRYYDPRVFRTYLPTCTAQEADVIYGETTWFAMESSDGAALLRFPLRNGRPQRRLIPLAAPKQG